MSALGQFYKLDKGLLTITSAAATDPYSGKEVIHQMEFRAAPALGLLRASAERPRGRSAANKRDEVPSPHRSPSRRLSQQ